MLVHPACRRCCCSWLLVSTCAGLHVGVVKEIGNSKWGRCRQPAHARVLTPKAWDQQGGWPVLKNVLGLHVAARICCVWWCWLCCAGLLQPAHRQRPWSMD
jgi:hypothetical protein